MLPSLLRAMQQPQTTPRTHFVRPLLAELHSWWFRDVPQRQDAELSPDVMKWWFGSSEETDNICREKYRGAAEEAGGMTASEIDTLVQSPNDAVAAVILLDQIPRNIFRGKEAAKAYTTYDPLARQLSKLYLVDREYGRRDAYPSFPHSMFLYMPLMHSEDLADHTLLAKLLSERKSASGSEAETKGIDSMIDFEEKHRAVVERFGRYPSRNEALDRKSTEAELKHLQSGPGW